jgi:hypothetical protein
MTMPTVSTLTTAQLCKAAQAVLAALAGVILAYPEAVSTLAGSARASRVIAFMTLISAFLPALGVSVPTIQAPAASPRPTQGPAETSAQSADSAPVVSSSGTPQA